MSVGFTRIEDKKRDEFIINPNRIKILGAFPDEEHANYTSSYYAGKENREEAWDSAVTIDLPQRSIKAWYEPMHWTDKTKGGYIIKMEHTICFYSKGKAWITLVTSAEESYTAGYKDSFGIAHQLELSSGVLHKCPTCGIWSSLHDLDFRCEDDTGELICAQCEHKYSAEEKEWMNKENVFKRHKKLFTEYVRDGNDQPST